MVRKDELLDSPLSLLGILCVRGGDGADCDSFHPADITVRSHQPEFWEAANPSPFTNKKIEPLS